MAAATITERAAGAIIGLLDRVAYRAGAEAVDAAEKTLVEQAPGLTMDQLNRVLVRAEAWLDPDGVAPREDEKRGAEHFIMREVDGMFELTGRVTPEHGAPVRTAIDALVSAEMRATGDAQRAGTADPDLPRRSVVQMQADALVRLCEHALGCDETDLPLHGATVVVRIAHDDLVNGTGFATIDGVTAPVSSSTARRMAAGGRIISCVLGGDSQILDWGRTNGSSPPLNAWYSSNATADARCAGHHPATPRSTTSGGGHAMPDPPTWTTGCCYASRVTTASTTTNGTFASTV